MTDLRPLTIATDTVEAKEVRIGDLVMDESKLIEVVHVHPHRGFVYIGLENGDTLFRSQTDRIRKIRR